MLLLRFAAAAVSVLAAVATATRPTGTDLGPAPLFDHADLVDDFAETQNRQRREESEFALMNPEDRSSVAQTYTSHLLAGEPDSKYSGDPVEPQCTVGSVSSGYLAVCQEWDGYEYSTSRLNLYRALTRLPAIVHDDIDGALCQEAATIFAHGYLSHYPETTAPCYTQNAHFAAGKSNIGWGRSGAGAVDQYMDDAGAGNSAVGHRRWFLWPHLGKIGFGFVDIPYGQDNLVPSSCAMVLNGGTVQRPVGLLHTAWPPIDAFVPRGLMPTSSRRWSYSRDNADLSAATVVVHRTGSVKNLVTKIEIVNDGFGDNTLVFVVDDVRAYDYTGDQAYVVEIENVSTSKGVINVAYNVTVINPALTEGDPLTTPSPTTTSTTTTTTTLSCPKPVWRLRCMKQCDNKGFDFRWYRNKDGCPKVCECRCRDPVWRSSCKAMCDAEGFDFRWYRKRDGCRKVCDCRCRDPVPRSSCLATCDAAGLDTRWYRNRDGCPSVCTCL